MYECEIVELEDYNFNHVLHHYDLDVRETIEYIQEHDAAGSHLEYCGDVYLDEI